MDSPLFISMLMIIEEIFFILVRYIPFWAVPAIMISAQFFYIYWLKSHRKVAFLCVGVAFFAFLSIIFYYWAGGPEQSIHRVRSFFSLF